MARPTPEQQEDAFQRFLQNTEAYNAAIIAAGDQPWHLGDIDARRELFMRRYK